MKKKKIKEITIIGPGLIGGSIGMGLKKKKIVDKIVGIDISKKNLQDAIKKKIIDDSRQVIDERISKSEIIFVCTPVSSTNDVLENLLPFLSKKNIVTDTGSVKNIFKKSTLKKIISMSNFIPGHPVAGTEHSGAKNAMIDLFVGKWCILTPLKQHKFERKIISELWESLGMKIAIMTSNEHDKIMSITSHLPHLIAFTIVNTAFDFDLKKKKELINFSAGGFRDFTRIGSSDPNMWSDIFMENKKQIINTLDNFIGDLKNFRELIKKNQKDKIFKILKRTKVIRKSILKANELKK